MKLSQVELKNDAYVEVSGKTKLSQIENTYQAGTVTITKSVTGNMGNKSTKFNFKVVLESDKPVNSTVVSTGDKTFTFTANDNGKYTAEQTYKLADGETWTITNLPFGVTYTVYEMNGEGETATAVAQGNTLTAESKTYTVSYDAAKTGALSASAEKHQIATTVTNNCGDDTIDTGVILDNAPYMLMLAVVAGGAMTLVIKKRREEE